MLKPQFCRHETQSSNQVPVDLLVDILSLVPAKSIARFRCVSKLWASIFRRQDFTELFLTKSSTRPLLLFTFKVDDKLFLYSTIQPHNPDDNSSLVATPFKSFPKNVPSSTSTPVCGLVLLHGWRKKVRVICNPATGEFRPLPRVLLKEKLAKNNNYRDTIAKEKIVGMYLGYDPKGKHFKVLCMSTSRYGIRDNTHRVLTLGPGKRFWRPVEHKFHFVKNPNKSREICINGVLYFGAWFERSSTIVCFNVGSEKFSFIYTYEDMSRSYYGDYLTLFNYKGKLGLLEDSSQDKLMFWVLEDAENHKWSKHVYVLPPLEEDVITYTMFVGVSGTGEFVWSSSYNGPPHSLYLTFYNLESGTCRKVYIRGLDEFKQNRSLSIKTYLDYVENVKCLM
ncbi:hypothetical protein Bca101_023279 [Brassica carinata]